MSMGAAAGWGRTLAGGMICVWLCSLSGLEAAEARRSGNREPASGLDRAPLAEALPRRIFPEAAIRSEPPSERREAPANAAKRPVWWDSPGRGNRGGDSDPDRQADGVPEQASSGGTGFQPAEGGRAEGGSADREARVLEPDDLIRITVYQEDDLSGEYRISGDGTIQFPYLGKIILAGKTPSEVSEMIRDLLAKDVLVNPQVTLTVLDYRKPQFTIVGAVARPGTYEVSETAPLSLIEAIGLAGGFKPGAKRGKVKVTRVVDGQAMTREIDATAQSRGREARSFQVVAGDHIQVEENFW